MKLAEFLEWLKQNADVTVGVLGPHSTYLDPICLYLYSRSMRDVLVDERGNYTYLDNNSNIREVEGAWLNFASNEIHTQLAGKVTGAQVLATLDKIMELLYTLDKNGG